MDIGESGDTHALNLSTVVGTVRRARDDHGMHRTSLEPITNRDPGDETDGD